MYDWLARSRELTTCDIFIWKWLKGASLLYKIKNMEELERKINEVMFSIPEEFLVKSIDAILGRLVKLVARAHIEIKINPHAICFPFFVKIMVNK